MFFEESGECKFMSKLLHSILPLVNEVYGSNLLTNKYALLDIFPKYFDSILATRRNLSKTKKNAQKILELSKGFCKFHNI
jgi:hypothetical protein